MVATEKPERTRLAGTIGAISSRSIETFVRTCLRAIGPDRKLLGLTLIISFVSGALQTVLLFLLAMLAVALSSSEGVPKMSIFLRFAPHMDYGQLLGVTGALLLGVLTLTVPLARLQATLATRGVARARSRLIRAYLGASLAYRSAQREGYLQQLIGEYSQNVATALQQFSAFCVAGATLAILLAAPLVLNRGVGAMEIATILLSYALLGPVTHWLKADSVTRSAANRALSMGSTETVRMAAEIEVFDVGEQIFARLDERIVKAAAAQRRLSFRDLLMPQLYQYGALAIMLISVAVLVTFYPGRHPGLSATALLTIRVLGYGRQMLVSAQGGSMAVPHIETVLGEIAALEAHPAVRGTRTDVTFDGLRLDGVSFAYKAGRAILHEASLTIAPGEAIGLVGPSGEGKSTICGLLIGNRAASAGSITTGGIEIGEIAPARWARIAAYVPQQPKLLTASVSDNIRFYRAGFDEDAVIAAAQAAHIHEEILALPKGYDTVVGTGARGLSGGQQQRLVIARALLGQPRLLILDEPSSALDARSERLIAETLGELKGHTAMVIVSHRPAALKACDRVLTLTGGKFREAEAAA